MIRAFGGVLDGLEGDLGAQAMVQFPCHGVAAGAACLLRGHDVGSAYTTLKPYSAYTTSGDNA